MNLFRSYRYRGRHRLERQSNHLVLNATMLAAIVGPTLTPGVASADPPGGWDPIIACESGGKNIHTQIVGPYTASGYFQITTATWKRFGGTEFAASPLGATFAEQKIVANRIYAANPSLSDWNASKGCWSKTRSQPHKVVIADPPIVHNVPKKLTPKVPTQPVIPHAHELIVKPGDTLSEISPGDWHSVWRNNRVVIGDNPNLIFPGQRLKV